MRLKKYVLLSFAVILALFTMPFFGFNDVKALSLTPITTSSYGSYSAEVYYASSDTYPSEISVGIPGLFQVAIPQADTSVFHFHYDFDTEQSIGGLITITVDSTRSYVLNNANIAVSGGYIQSTSSKTANTTSKTFSIGMYNTDHIDLYITCTATFQFPIFSDSTTFTISHNLTTGLSEYYLIDHMDTVLSNVVSYVSLISGTLGTCVDYKLSDMADTFSDMLNAIQDKADYQVEYESMYAYYFVLSDLSTMQVDYTDGNISTAVSVVEDQRTRTLNVPAETTLYFYYYTSVNNITFKSASTASIDWVAEQIPPATTTWRLRRITIINDTVDAINVYFTWKQDGVIVPLYLGDGRNMSLVMQSMTHYDSPNMTTDLLNQIISKIEQLFGGEGYDTTGYDSIVNSVNTFIVGLQNYMPSSGLFENDVNGLPDLVGRNSPFNFQAVSNFVDTIYNGIADAVPGFSVLVIGGLLVLLVKVFV